MPKEEYIEGLDTDEPGKFHPGKSVEELFAGWEGKIRPVKGRFAETIPTLPKDLKFVLAYLDCDLYHSYMQVMEYLIAGNHMVPGGVIVSDDYWCLPGARKAVDIYLEKYSLRSEYDGGPMVIYL
jgi:hypothetical protein